MNTSKLFIYFWLAFNLVICNSVSAQNLTQTIRGTILDEDSKSPLIGASVIINGSNPARGSATNANGEFRFENIPVGRIGLTIRYMGYEEKSMPNILVGTGKEVILSIELKESLVKMEEVLIKAAKHKGDALNEMAIISARSFSVDETKRYAGSFQDPSRMVSAYAGVTSDPNGNNDIIVRGNSPKGILWRMEGVEIPNPNHFANEGSTGGAISALNSELLSNSDFYTGAFSPEYGDALSGVFDIKMRAGNNEKREYSVGIGALGTDVTLEGPFSKTNGSSYLANYRYSSLQLLDKAGLVDFDGIPKYQDAAFKVVLPTKHLGTTSVFGLGGLSSILNIEKDNNEQIAAKATYAAQLGVFGINHILPISQNTFIKLTLSAANNGSHYRAEELDANNNFVFTGKGKWEKSSIRTAFLFSSKINAKNRLITGITNTRQFYNLYEYYFSDDLKKWVTSIDRKVNANNIQGFVCWKYRINEDLTFVGGVHSMYFSLNKNITFEPRLALSWQLTPNQTLNFGYGLHSKAESIITYFTHVNLPDGSETTPNNNLGFSMARHWVMGYDYRLSKNLNLKIELYYQKLFNIPVENVDTSRYSILNSDEGYIDKSLVNAGTGMNYGMEFTLERFFDNNFYSLVTTSLYQSKYKSLEGVTRNTKYNGNYAFNFLIGKEFRMGNGVKANTLGINSKFLLSGGRRRLPVNETESKAKGVTVYDYTHAWEKKLDNIIQINFSISYRINRPKTSHELVLDILNVTNAQGRTSEYYNKYKDKTDYYRQLNLLPNIMYRIHF